MSSKCELWLRNRKHFPCFHTVIAIQVEVWENEKLKWEHEHILWLVFPRNFEFSQTSTSVSITYGNMGKNVFYFFYKITRRKLKRGDSLLYWSVNSPYCLWWRMRWHIMVWTFPCFPYSFRNTAFNQSKLTFSKCYFINIIITARVENLFKMHVNSCILCMIIRDLRV